MFAESASIESSILVNYEIRGGDENQRLRQPLTSQLHATVLPLQQSLQDWEGCCQVSSVLCFLRDIIVLLPLTSSRLAARVTDSLSPTPTVSKLIMCHWVHFHPPFPGDDAKHPLLSGVLSARHPTIHLVMNGSN